MLREALQGCSWTASSCALLLQRPCTACFPDALLLKLLQIVLLLLLLRLLLLLLLTPLLYIAVCSTAARASHVLKHRQLQQQGRAAKSMCRECCQGNTGQQTSQASCSALSSVQYCDRLRHDHGHSVHLQQQASCICAACSLHGSAPCP